LASAAFVLLLLAAHGAGDLGERVGQPLSVFRDGEQGWWGYLLFASLLLIGALYTRDLVRAGKEEEAVPAGLAALLLLFVAMTPSWSVLHLLCAAGLFSLLFRHYWWLLRESGSPWRFPHLLAPLALVWVSGCHSYGLWQKGLILYFVALANVRRHLLRPEAAGRCPSVAIPRTVAGGGRNGRRRVYRLEPGREWARRKVR
jgi:hypothetical protein